MPPVQDDIITLATRKGKLSAEDIGQLSQLTESLAADPQESTARIASLDGQTNEASTWLRAFLLTNLGDWTSAAEQLRTLWWTTEGETRGLLLFHSAKMLLRAGRLAEVWYPLAQAARHSPNAKQLRQIDRLLRDARKLAAPSIKRTCRVALLSNFTIDTILPILRAQCFGAGIDVSLYVGPFDQIVQEIQGPSSALNAFAPEVVVIAADARWPGFTEETADPEKAVASSIAQCETLWKACQERWGAHVLQCNFETPIDPPLGPLSALLPGGRSRLLHSLNLELWRAAEKISGVTIVDLDQAAARFGKEQWADAILWQLAKQYPAAEALPALGAEITSTLRAVYGLTAKCAVLDLDGTLWGGVIGEDGLTGIQLGGSPAGEAFSDFQRYLRALSASGILLAVCSKNNEPDARAPFNEHPEMVLKESDLACFCANWQPKEENLRYIAKTLNIGTDALAFIDDNPAERARIRQYMPEVEVIELPAEPALFAQTIARSRVFDKISLTNEDRARTQSIRQNAERQEMASSAANLDEYLAGLGIRVHLTAFDEANLPRITQLINKTNQFNLTTRRRTEGEVRLLIEQGCYTQAARVSDRFGDSGLTGVIIAIPEGDSLRIDTWLLSCRVMGRRIEEVMFSALVACARKRGFQIIRGEFIPTAKNAVVSGLFTQLAFDKAELATNDSQWYSWPVNKDMPMPSALEYLDETS